MSIFSIIGGALEKTLDYVSAIPRDPKTAFTNPAKAAADTKNIRLAIQSGDRSLAAKTTAKIITNTAIASTAVLTGGTSAGRTAVTSAAKNILFGSPTRTVLTALTTPVVVGAVVSNPKIATATAEQALNLPSNLSAFGADIGELSKNPSLETATKFVKDHPVAVTAAILSSGFLAGKAFSFLNTAYNSYLARKTLDEKAKDETPPKKPTVEDPVQEVISSPTGQTIVNIYQTQPTSADIPISAPVGEQPTETKPIIKTTKKKKKKKTTKKKKKKTTKKKKKKTTKKKKKTTKKKKKKK